MNKSKAREASARILYIFCILSVYFLYIICIFSMYFLHVFNSVCMFLYVLICKSSDGSCMYTRMCVCVHVCMYVCVCMCASCMCVHDLVCSML